MSDPLLPLPGDGRHRVMLSHVAPFAVTVTTSRLESSATSSCGRLVDQRFRLPHRVQTACRVISRRRSTDPVSEADPDDDAVSARPGSASGSYPGAGGQLHFPPRSRRGSSAAGSNPRPSIQRRSATRRPSECPGSQCRESRPGAAGFGPAGATLHEFLYGADLDAALIRRSSSRRAAARSQSAREKASRRGRLGGILRLMR